MADLGNFRIGKYNGWLVLGGVAAAIVLGLYLKNHLGSSSSAASQPTSSTLPATDSSGGSSGGASDAGAASTPDLTPFEDLASSIYGLTSVLGAGGGSYTIGGSGSTAGNTATAAQTQTTAPTSSATTSPYVNSLNPGTIYQTPTGETVALQPSGAFEPAYIGPSGSFVSPATYEGLGVAPSAPNPSEIAPNPAPQQVPRPPGTSATTILPAPGPNIPQRVSGSFQYKPPPAPPPLSAGGAKKTGTNPRKTGTLH